MDLNASSSISWQQVINEYRSAKLSLEQLLKEGGSLAENAERLIVDLDEHFRTLENRVAQAVDFNHSLTPPIPPAVDRTKLKGMLAYRAWCVRMKGVLSPVMGWHENETWRGELSFADQPPSRDNTHGLYATRIERWVGNSYGDEYCGLVDLYGKVVEHADGVLRGECGRIVMILIQVTEASNAVAMVTGAYELVKYNYPNVPVHIVTPLMKKLILWREALVNYGAI